MHEITSQPQKNFNENFAAAECWSSSSLMMAVTPHKSLHFCGMVTLISVYLGFGFCGVNNCNSVNDLGGIIGAWSCGLDTYILLDCFIWYVRRMSRKCANTFEIKSTESVDYFYYWLPSIESRWSGIYVIWQYNFSRYIDHI